MTASHDSELLTIAEAMQLLKVGRTMLHRWLKAGRLRAYHVGPRAVRIRRGDLEAVMTPVEGGKIRDVNGVRATPIATTIRPLTDEEIERGLQAVEDAKALTAAMRTRRGGKPMAESWPLIREERERRESRL